MAIDTYITEAGESFKADTLVLAGVLSRYGFQGSELGRLIRGEEPIPLDRSVLVLDAGAKFRSPGISKPRAPQGPNISKLWDSLVNSLAVSVKGQGADVGDFFLQSGEEPEDFDSWLQNASGDLAMSFEHALTPKARDLLDRFELALTTGIYQKDSYETWSLRQRKSLLREIYADYWYAEMHRAWDKLQRDPKAMARLLSMR